MMTTPIQCFWLEETMRAQRFLRRFASRTGDDIPSDDPCPAHGYHNEMVYVDDIPFEKTPSKYANLLVSRYTEGATDERNFVGDPRWPAKCACGYEFLQTDRWQIFTENIMRRTDDGSETTLRDAGPGAMWDAWWYGTFWPGPDGLHLMVRCPPAGEHADWFVDGFAGNGPRDAAGWTRTGDPCAKPPTVTANPSIQITNGSKYHGWLRNGVLVPA